MRVQARDTSLEDAPATTIAETVSAVQRGTSAELGAVELHVGDLPRHATVWAHVDVDRDGRVSPGDFVTTAAYAVPTEEGGRVDVRVRKV